MNSYELIKDICPDYETMCDKCNANGSCSVEYTAMRLIDKNWRKIADDEIVVKKSEYEALLLEQKRLKEMVDRIPCGYVQKEEAEYWKSRCTEIGDVASNETARDILHELAIYAEEDDNGQVAVDWYHLETLAERYEFYLER